MSESIHAKLERVRPPRVHIKYEVHIGDATEIKDLPFIVGVMGDFTGNNPGEKPKPLKDRQFINIDRDNFNDVMKRMTPGVILKEVPNTLQGDNTTMTVSLKFQSMDDFEPARVVEQVEPLRKLLEKRNRLRDLAAQADRSGDLEGLLEEILQNTDKLKQMHDSLHKKSE